MKDNNLYAIIATLAAGVLIAIVLPMAGCLRLDYIADQNARQTCIELGGTWLSGPQRQTCVWSREATDD